MSISGPNPSSFYLERQAATRSPATPTVPGLNGAALRTSNQAAGRIDPGIATQTAGDGLILANLMAIVVSVWPNPGLTLTGGTLLCWVFNPYQQNWSRCPDLDVTITAGTYTGPVGYTVSTFVNASRLGMNINWAASSLTGTSQDFLIRLDGFNSVLGMSV